MLQVILQETNRHSSSTRDIKRIGRIEITLHRIGDSSGDARCKVRKLDAQGIITNEAVVERFDKKRGPFALLLEACKQLEEAET